MHNLNVLNSLRRLGLNQYEAKAFLTLTTNGILTAGELSNLAGLPRPRVYDILVELKRKGFVKFNDKEKLVRYESVPLKKALDTYKVVRAEEVKDEAKQFDELGLKLGSILKKGKTVNKLENSESVWTLKGRDSIYTKLSSMIQNAKEDIFVISTQNGVERKLAEHGLVLENASKKGVKVSIVSPQVAAEASKMAKIHSKSLPTRMILADDQALVFLTEDDAVLPQEEVGMWLQSRGFVDTLKKAVNNK